MAADHERFAAWASTLKQQGEILRTMMPPISRTMIQAGLCLEEASNIIKRLEKEANAGN